MVFSVISLLKSEGKKRLFLGLSPFSHLNSKLSLNTLLFKLIYSFNLPRFGYKGIHKYLTKFHAIHEPKYFASLATNTIPILWKTWKMMSD